MPRINLSPLLVIFLIVILHSITPLALTVGNTPDKLLVVLQLEGIQIRSSIDPTTNEKIERSFATLSLDVQYFGEKPPEVAISTERVTDKGTIQMVNVSEGKWIMSGLAWKPERLMKEPFILSYEFAHTDFTDWPDEYFSTKIYIEVTKLQVPPDPNYLTIEIVGSVKNAGRDIHYYELGLRTIEKEIIGDNMTAAFVDLVIDHRTMKEAFRWISFISNWWGLLVLPFAVLEFVALLRISCKFPRLLRRLGCRPSTIAILAATILVFIPILSLSIREIVPPWINFVDSAVGMLFSSFFIIFIGAFLLTLFLEHKWDDSKLDDKLGMMEKQVNEKEKLIKKQEELIKRLKKKKDRK